MIATVTAAILALIPIEAAALVLYHRRSGRGISPGRLLANLAAGFSLMMAVHLATGVDATPRRAGAGKAKGCSNQASRTSRASFRGGKL